MNREAGHRVGTMTHTAGQAASSGDARFYSDRPNRSPRIAQFEPDGAPRPLGGDTTADVVIVGAGIAGIAATFFLLRECPERVLLVERDRVTRGTSGRNAGQLTTYFERPLCQLPERFGWELVGEAQRGFEDAHELLDLMAATSGAVAGPCERNLERSSHSRNLGRDGLALPKGFHGTEIGVGGLGSLKQLVCFRLFYVEHSSGMRTETVTIGVNRLLAHGNVVEMAKSILQLL